MRLFVDFDDFVIIAAATAAAAAAGWHFDSKRLLPTCSAQAVVFFPFLYLLFRLPRQNYDAIAVVFVLVSVRH